MELEKELEQFRQEAQRLRTGRREDEGKEKAQQPVEMAGLLNVEAVGIEPAAWHSPHRPRTADLGHE